MAIVASIRSKLSAMTDVWDEIVSARVARRDVVLADAAARVAKEDAAEQPVAVAPKIEEPKVEAVAAPDEEDAKAPKAKPSKG